MTSEFFDEERQVGITSEGAAQVATLLTTALKDDRRFGALIAGDDSNSLTLEWHGDPPTDAIETARSSYPDVAVTVRDLPVLPGDLRDAMGVLMRDGQTTGVNAAHISADWTAIIVLVDEDAVHEGLADELTERVDFPVRVEPGSISPAKG